MPSRAVLLHSQTLLCKALLFSLVLVSVAACSSDDNEGGSSGGQPTPEVAVETVEKQDVDVRQDYAGRASGAREVEVRARVQGILEARLYNEGQIVEEGDVLFRIDPKPSEADVQQAKAERQVAEANLQQAEREWRRISSLYDRKVISERDRDSAQSNLELARANAAVADAGLTRAELNLGYTNVTAPVSGVTSLEDLPEGSLVEQGTLLTTVIQQDPIHVRFSLPENDASIQRTAREAMTRSEADSVREVTLIWGNGAEYSRTGEVDFTASTLDSRTGSVSARAVFPNPDNDIIPGQFVRVRIGLQRLEQVAVVPETIIGEGPKGAQVFVVQEDSTVVARPVELGPVVEAGQVILKGLDEGDRVVINGQVGLQDGASVSVEGASEKESN